MAHQIDITIWKYPLRIVDEQVIEMPAGASPMSAQFQGSELVLWAAVVPEAEREPRTVTVIGTGNLSRLTMPARYVSTAQDPDRPLVWHVYVSENRSYPSPRKDGRAG